MINIPQRINQDSWDAARAKVAQRRGPLVTTSMKVGCAIAPVLAGVMIVFATQGVLLPCDICTYSAIALGAISLLPPLAILYHRKKERDQRFLETLAEFVPSQADTPETYLNILEQMHHNEVKFTEEDYIAKFNGEKNREDLLAEAKKIDSGRIPQLINGITYEIEKCEADQLFDKRAEKLKEILQDDNLVSNVQILMQQALFADPNPLQRDLIEKYTGFNFNFLELGKAFNLVQKNGEWHLEYTVNYRLKDGGDLLPYFRQETMSCNLHTGKAVFEARWLKAGSLLQEHTQQPQTKHLGFASGKIGTVNREVGNFRRDVIGIPDNVWTDATREYLYIAAPLLKEHLSQLYQSEGFEVEPSADRLQVSCVNDKLEYAKIFYLKENEKRLHQIEAKVVINPRTEELAYQWRFLNH